MEGLETYDVEQSQKEVNAVMDRAKAKAEANGKQPELTRVDYDVFANGKPYKVREGLEYHLGELNDTPVIGRMKRPFIKLVREFDRLRAEGMKAQIRKAEKLAKEGDNAITVEDTVAAFDPGSPEYAITLLGRQVELVLSGLPDNWQDADGLSTDFMRRIKDDFLSMR